MTDDIHNDKQNIRLTKHEILDDIGYFSRHNTSNKYIKSSIRSMDKYSVHYVLFQAQLYLHSTEYLSDLRNNIIGPNEIRSLEYSLMGFNSQYHTDLRNNTKVSEHVAIKEQKRLVKDFENSLKPYHLSKKENTAVKNYINKSKKNEPVKVTYSFIRGARKLFYYNYNRGHKDRDTFESPNHSWKMTSNVLHWKHYRGKLKTLIKKYSKKKPDTIKDVYKGHKLYLPKSLNPEDIYGLNDYLNKYRIKANFYNHETNNEYSHMWNQLYSGDWHNARHSYNDDFLNDLNNHPHTDLHAERRMVKADTNYKYRIQKDRNWEQYHQDQIDRMQSYANNLAKAYHKNIKSLIQNKKRHIKHVAHKGDTFIGLGRKYHIPWKAIQSANPKINPYRIPIGYHLIIPTKSSYHRLSKIDKKILRYSKGGLFYKMELKLKNKWKNRADRLNHRLKNKERKELNQAYLNATIDNIKLDHRHKHYAFIAPRHPETQDSYVFMQVTDESPNHSTNTTTTPIEWGRNITTTTQKQPTQVSITGNLFNYNLPHRARHGKPSKEPNNGKGLEPVKKDAKNIDRWSDRGDPVLYCGTNCYPHAIITEFNPDYNTGPNGSLTTCSFSMTLQVADYFKSNTHHRTGRKKHAKSKHTGNKGRKRGKRSTKRHRKKYIRAKSGYTYSLIALKKHVPVSRVIKLNKYPSRDIPIGAKIYF